MLLFVFLPCVGAHVRKLVCLQDGAGSLTTATSWDKMRKWLKGKVKSGAPCRALSFCRLAHIAFLNSTSDTFSRCVQERLDQ